MTTPRPQSFVADFKDLRRRVRTLEAVRRGSATVSPTTYIADAAGNVVVSADGISGRGLGQPALPVPFHPNLSVVDSTGWAATTSTSFTDVMYAAHRVQHLYFAAEVDVVCSADTAAEIQFLDGGIVLGETQIVDVGGSVTLSFICLLLGEYGALTTLQLQARRTAGTGSVRVQVPGAWGTQTPLA